MSSKLSQAMVEPAIAAHLSRLRAPGLPLLSCLSPSEARRQYDASKPATQLSATDIYRVADHRIAGGDGQPLVVREYRPRPKSGPTPALLYFHGGGWLLGSLDSHDALCRKLAVQSGIPVFSVGYRLAPEAPFPAGLNDCLSAFEWMLASAESLMLDRERIAVGGDSAGGNLAAALSLCLRESQCSTTRPALQVLLYPVTHLANQSASYDAFGEGYGLTRDSMNYFRHHYVGDARDLNDWRISPLAAQDLSGLPPALVITAGCDPLRDEGQDFAQRLSLAGVETNYVCFSRQIHGFALMDRITCEAETAVLLCAGSLCQLNG